MTLLEQSPMQNKFGIGIDIGTSGVRAVALDAELALVAMAQRPFSDYSGDPRDPQLWWQVTIDVVTELLSLIDRNAVAVLAVDGTSGTLIAVDHGGVPVAAPLMYNDKVTDPDLVRLVRTHAPMDSGAHGPSSGLAKALRLQAAPGVAHLLHQANWITGQFSRRFDVTDENNALKTGYDAIGRTWGEWIGKTGLRLPLLPEVVPPGTVIGPIGCEVAEFFGLPPSVLIASGTTDGCASFIATGADQPGDAVTALGSSLTLKILSDRPIFSPRYGIYSHRLGPYWLAGGASNSGGKVLASFFTTKQIAELSGQIDPHRKAMLNFYPLTGPGERFPVADAYLAPRVTPRPSADAEFLHELLAGISDIEAEGYKKLDGLGAPPLRSIRSVGGGARNGLWRSMRAERLGVPFLQALSEEAAVGTARLAISAITRIRSE